MSSIIDKVGNDEERELGHVYWLNLRYTTRDGIEHTKPFPFVQDFSRFIYLDALKTIPIPWHFAQARKQIFEALWHTRKFEVKNSYFKEWLQGWISINPVEDNFDMDYLTLHQKKLAIEFLSSKQTKKKEGI